jgi:hypothetical protein
MLSEDEEKHWNAKEVDQAMKFNRSSRASKERTSSEVPQAEL